MKYVFMFLIFVSISGLMCAPMAAAIWGGRAAIAFLLASIASSVMLLIASALLLIYALGPFLRMDCGSNCVIRRHNDSALSAPVGSAVNPQTYANSLILKGNLTAGHPQNVRSVGRGTPLERTHGAAWVYMLLKQLYPHSPGGSVS